MREVRGARSASFCDNRSGGRSPPEGAGRPEDTEAWVAAGEVGYVNCLLTVLAEGSIRTATVAPTQPLPSLEVLAAGTTSLVAWAKQLTFPFANLSTRVILDTLVESFGLGPSGTGTLKSILVRTDGAPLAVLFTARRAEPGGAVTITALPIPSV